MKKVCFISLTNIYQTPYIKKYEELLQCKYDIIYWNREHKTEITNADNMYVYKCSKKNNESKFGKLFGYLGFRHFALKLLRENKYSKIIILHNQAAVMLKSFLIKNYKGKYLFDIRDYTFERIKLYYNAEIELADNSGLNVISSKGFLKFLPKANYVPVHNDLKVDTEIIKQHRNKEKIIKDKISISNIGVIRFQEQDQKTIMAFKDDKRFELKFIGTGAQKLASFCIENNTQNVVLKDSFPPSESIKYFCEADIVSNIFGNNSPLVDFLLSNKLYYSAQLGIPILVCPDTYMEQVTLSYGIGFTCDLDDPKITDKLFDYYNNINWDEFYDKCDKFIKEVETENNEFKKRVQEFLSL